MNQPKILTSDRVIALEFTEPFDLPEVELIRVLTEKGMRLKIDKKRFGNIQVGDQIDIYLEVIK